MARYWLQFKVFGVVSGVVLVELHRVATATMPFFCFTTVPGNDRKALLVESMDAIPLAANVGGWLLPHVTSDVISIPTPIRSLSRRDS